MAKKKAKKTVKKAAKKTAVKKKTTKATLKPNVAAAPRSTTISPYLTFDGNCEEAFNFYKSVFGGKFGYLGRFSEMPPSDGNAVPPDQANKIMHVSLPISKETMLMGSDSSAEFGQATITGNNFSVSINAASQAKADKLFNGLSSGGMVTMPMNKTFWGSYFGMLTDKFGVQWMISFDASPAY